MAGKADKPKPPNQFLRLAILLALNVVLVVAAVIIFVNQDLLLTNPKPKIEWVKVPAGEFMMGSSNADIDVVLAECKSCERSWYANEQPQHRVALDAYRIGKYEVSNAQYAQCVKSQACEKPAHPIAYGNPDYADHPVVDASWYDAATFCAWIGGRLPTEAEWEYAARGSEGMIYSWGNEFDCSRGNFDDETELTEYVVPGGEGCDGYMKTAPVGSFESDVSWCGVQDMSGNVSEWTNDWYDNDYYSVSPHRNPPGPASGEFKVVRGGGWNYYAPSNIRAVYRFYFAPVYKPVTYFVGTRTHGFRCVHVPAE